MAPFLLALGAREFVGGPLVERAINKQERCREWNVLAAARQESARTRPISASADWVPARVC